MLTVWNPCSEPTDSTWHDPYHVLYGIASYCTGSPKVYLHDGYGVPTENQHLPFEELALSGSRFLALSLDWTRRGPQAGKR